MIAQFTLTYNSDCGTLHDIALPSVMFYSYGLAISGIIIIICYDKSDVETFSKRLFAEGFFCHL